MIKKPLYIALCLTLFISVEVIAYPSSVQNSFDQQDTFDFDNTIDIDIEEYIDTDQPIAHGGPPHRHKRRCYRVPGPPVWGPWGWRRSTVRECRPVIVYEVPPIDLRPPPPRRRPGYRPSHPPRPNYRHPLPPPPRRRHGYRPGHPRRPDYRPHDHPRPRRPRHSQRSRHSSPSHNFEDARDRHLPLEDLENRYLSPSARSPENEENRLPSLPSHSSEDANDRPLLPSRWLAGVEDNLPSLPSHSSEAANDRPLLPSRWLAGVEDSLPSLPSRSSEAANDRPLLPSRWLAGVEDNLPSLPSRSSEAANDRPLLPSRWLAGVEDNLPSLPSRSSTEDIENVYIYTYCDHRRNLRDIRTQDEQDDLVKNLLFNAICDNENTIVGFLLEDRGYFINEVVFTGETPLILAIKLENMDIVRLLVESFDADICREIQGLTAIGWAEELRNEGIFEYLEERSSQCF